MSHTGQINAFIILKYGIILTGYIRKISMLGLFNWYNVGIVPHSQNDLYKSLIDKNIKSAGTKSMHNRRGVSGSTALVCLRFQSSTPWRGV